MVNKPGAFPKQLVGNLLGFFAWNGICLPWQASRGAGSIQIYDF
jgi:hypothetical protein